MASMRPLKSCGLNDDDPRRAHHRRFGFVRRRRHPGRPQELCRARRLRRLRHHRADRAEYARRQRHPSGAGRFRHRADRCGISPISTSHAVKIGMVAQLATIDAIVAGLTRWSPKHVVLDPVMVATSGDRLLAADAIAGAANQTHSTRRADHAESAGSRRAARRAGRGKRGRDRAPGQEAAGAGMSGRTDQGRSRAGRGEHRLSRHGRERYRASRTARRNQKHPRHRMLAVLGDRGRPCQRRGHGSRRSPCQGLGQRGDRSSRSSRCWTWAWSDPSFPSVLLTHRIGTLGHRLPLSSRRGDPVRRGFSV